MIPAAVRATGGENDVGETQRLHAGFAAFIVVLTIARVIGVVLAPVELHGDEAQYWAWSQTLSWGYFSKPPLIAWVIWATTGVFGEAEWAIRLAAPIAHGVTALCAYALARDLYGPRAAVWAGVLYSLMPAVFLSSGVISTDAVLLPFWTFSLFALHRLIKTRALVWGITLGLAVGLGFLAKYAMIYFVVGAAAYLVLNAEARRAAVSLPGLLALAGALALIAPNLAWNAQNDFATVGHTAANANWQGSLFKPMELLDFWVSQLGVFGPVAMALLVTGLFARRHALGQDPTRFLLLFILPVLVVVSIQAFISRANANWAATAYPAACVFVAGWIAERGGWARIAGYVSSAARGVTGLVFAAATLSPAFADAIGLANAFKRARGWEDTAALVRATYEAGADGEPYALIAADNRLLYYDLAYYTREDPLPLRMWLRQDYPQSHAELFAPLAAPAPGPVLVINQRFHETARIQADFGRSELGETLVVPLGGERERRMRTVTGWDFAPLDRGPDYEARFRDDAD